MNKLRKSKHKVKKYAELHKTPDGKWPKWYYCGEDEDGDASGHDEDALYPPEQPHPTTSDYDNSWGLSIDPVGPAGFLIESVL